MLRYLIATLIILLLLLAWIAVQAWARRYATRHPEFGPAKEEGTGCGSHCGCAAEQCQPLHRQGKYQARDVRPGA